MEKDNVGKFSKSVRRESSIEYTTTGEGKGAIKYRIRLMLSLVDKYPFTLDRKAL